MTELQLQKLIVDAVNNAGGFSHKMSNRFLIGVSDLIIKLPVKNPDRAFDRKNPPAGFLEVKQRTGMPKTTIFPLDVTVQQGRFLQKAFEAGMPTGIASFIQVGRDILLSVRPWGDARKHGYDIVGYRDYHLSIGPKAERGNNILTHLYNWVRECQGD